MIAVMTGVEVLFTKGTFNAGELSRTFHSVIAMM